MHGADDVRPIVFEVIHMSGGAIGRISIATLSLAGVSLLGALPGAQASSQTADLTEDERAAIEELEENLIEGSNSGDAQAYESLEALNSLNEGEVEELGDFITSSRDLASYANDPNAAVETDVEVVGDLSTEVKASFTGTRNATCTSTFTFLGISVTKMEMTGNYSVSNGTVTGTNSMSMRTVYQYEPTASTSYSDYSRGVTNSGNAQFQGTATVDRLAGSRSGVYQMTAYGTGANPSCGWVS